MKTANSFAMIVIACVLSSQARSMACGQERWPIKVLSDATAPTSFAPVWISIARLIALRAPPDLPATRLPSESTTYQLRATLLAYKLEPDEDYHLILADPQTGATMIAEIPSPNCAPTARLAKLWGSMRNELDGRYGGGGDSWTKAGATVVVSGVLFFDSRHEQRGMAPNAVELHPVMGLTIE